MSDIVGSANPPNNRRNRSWWISLVKPPMAKWNFFLPSVRGKPQQIFMKSNILAYIQYIICQKCTCKNLIYTVWTIRTPNTRSAACTETTWKRLQYIKSKLIQYTNIFYIIVNINTYVYECQNYMFAIMCIYIYRKEHVFKTHQFSTIAQAQHKTLASWSVSLPYSCACSHCYWSVSTVCHQCIASSKRWWKKWVDLEM